VVLAVFSMKTFPSRSRMTARMIFPHSGHRLSTSLGSPNGDILGWAVIRLDFPPVTKSSFLPQAAN